ncbi:MAG: flagellar assembly protein T N-terminal domain-containing protein [Succinivibrio sp.]
MKLLKIISVLCLAGMTLSAQAKWYTASGTGTDRNDAVNDAIRNIMLESGADVRIEQNFKNGVLQSDNVRISSKNPIKQLVVLEQETTLNTVRVTIKAFVDEKYIKAKCSGSLINKTILPIAFKFADSQAFQGSIGIENINKELDKLVMENLYKSTIFITKPMVKANFSTENHSDINSSYATENLSSIANRYGSQYVIMGTINSVSVSEVGENFLTKMIFIPTRSINFDIDVYDAINEQIIFHRNYATEADWPFKQNDFIDLRSDRFKGSDYGQRLYDLTNKVSKDLVYLLQCAPANARVIDLDGDDLVINLGRENGIKKGMNFALEQTASMSGPNGDNYSVYEKSNSVYKVVSVYPHAAKLHPVDLQSNTLNVNVNDVVTLIK